MTIDFETATTGKTAAQLISERVNSTKPNMGLQIWKNAPKRKILKTDVSIDKNYLIEKEIKDLKRVVTNVFGLTIIISQIEF